MPDDLTTPAASPFGQELTRLYLNAKRTLDRWELFDSQWRSKAMASAAGRSQSGPNNINPWTDTPASS